MAAEMESSMKVVPKLLVVFVIVNFIVLLYANPDKLHGKWIIESVVNEGNVEKLPSSIAACMEFDKNKMTYTMGRQGDIETSGTWRMEDNKVTMIEDGSTKKNIVIIKFDGDKCTMTTIDSKMVINLKRIKTE
jgi:hypothetical protein